ncbi:hypothetical protein [Nitrospirillum viridazoti]|uniref:hypothetical protein n=1 Tax=Nitrospirillum viridazoti TaxID=3144925 RepID=UPI000C1CA7CA|nr:hypothetical protein [Nitrospirillum amazonense]
MLLQGDGRITLEASSGTAFDQKMMQVGERLDRDARRTDFLAGASNRVEHPGRHDNDHPRSRFKVDK